MYSYAVGVACDAACDGFYLVKPVFFLLGSARFYCVLLSKSSNKIYGLPDYIYTIQ
jgi:hypothetical protein